MDEAKIIYRMAAVAAGIGAFIFVLALSISLTAFQIIGSYLALQQVLYSIFAR